MDIEKIKAAISSKTAEEIYNDFFISGEVWIFKRIFGDKWFEQYDEFKKYISDKLNVHYNDIGVAGSAKLGFSLNPKKNFKTFDDNSDMDIIIVSRKLFNEFWEQYLNDSYNPTTRINIHAVSFCIFRKYLTLSCFRNNEYYNNWLIKTGGFEKDIQLKFQISNDIHYRIFESWDSVKMYYMSSINKLKGLEEDEYNEDN
ncbi:MAG: hypothetical protein J6A19_03385 [Oscillospiraceae bacterium]|nr:hypothetical protein [Oscillospiraceae bacterium]